MTNKIIEAARQAEAYATSQTIDIVDWKAIAQERFYAIARAEALEDAAKVCDALKEKALASQDRKHLDDLTNTQIRMVAHLGHGNCAEAIRALKEQQHG